MKRVKLDTLFLIVSVLNALVQSYIVELSFVNLGLVLLAVAYKISVEYREHTITEQEKQLRQEFEEYKLSSEQLYQDLKQDIDQVQAELSKINVKKAFR